MKISKAHINLLWSCLKGNIKKIRYRFSATPALTRNVDNNSDNLELIVSLTSYGRRVEKTVYYTILSLLHQTLKPSRIVLWLDSDNWNESNVPLKLKKLESKGLEILFCEDIKSYKKLIPSLETFPEAVIVTVDDDVIYSPLLLESLFRSYTANPQSIHCTRASWVAFNQGKAAPYKTWRSACGSDDRNDENTSAKLFPVGIGGVLYPPRSLHHDVLDRTAFMKYCPGADDIWFWYMGVLNKFSHTFVNLPDSHYPFDAIYQAMHRGAALTHSNVGRNQNDLQLEELLKAYDHRGL